MLALHAMQMAKISL